MEYAAYGRALERCRGEFIPDVADARRVLMLGEGDGRFLAAFASRHAAAQIDYIDLSARMLTLARSRSAVSENSRVTFHHGDACEALLPANEYDLIVTHFFLDCLTEAQAGAIIHKLAGATTPDARWIISEFHRPPRGLASLRASLWISLLYFLFRILTGLRVRRIPNYAPMLLRHGFHLEKRRLRDAGLLVSELWRAGPSNAGQPCEASL